MDYPAADYPFARFLRDGLVCSPRGYEDRIKAGKKHTVGIL